jgi:hypothetical protein
MRSTPLTRLYTTAVWDDDQEPPRFAQPTVTVVFTSTPYGMANPWWHRLLKEKLTMRTTNDPSDPKQPPPSVNPEQPAPKKPLDAGATSATKAQPAAGDPLAGDDILHDATLTPSEGQPVQSPHAPAVTATSPRPNAPAAPTIQPGHAQVDNATPATPSQAAYPGSGKEPPMVQGTATAGHIEPPRATSEWAAPLDSRRSNDWNVGEEPTQAEWKKPLPDQQSDILGGDAWNRRDPVWNKMDNKLGVPNQIEVNRATSNVTPITPAPTRPMRLMVHVPGDKVLGGETLYALVQARSEGSKLSYEKNQPIEDHLVTLSASDVRGIVESALDLGIIGVPQAPPEEAARHRQAQQAEEQRQRAEAKDKK